MMGIIIIIGIVKDRALKGLMSAMLGFLSALIGVDGITGVTRFSFGVAGMYDELPLLPVVLGMFAFSQVLTLIAENSAQIVISDDAVKKSPFLNMKEMKYIGFETLRASVIGTVVGIIPPLAPPWPLVSATPWPRTATRATSSSARATPRDWPLCPLPTTRLWAAPWYLC